MSAGIIVITPGGPSVTPAGKPPHHGHGHGHGHKREILRAILARLRGGADPSACADELAAVLGLADYQGKEATADDGNPYS